MGYYSEFRYELVGDVKVNVDKIREIEEYFSDYENEIYGFADVKFQLENCNLEEITPVESYAKFYDDEEFAEKLSSAIESGGVKLLFTGEDGGFYGYLVEKNQVEKLISVIMTAREYEMYKKCKQEGGQS